MTNERVILVRFLRMSSKSRHHMTSWIFHAGSEQNYRPIWKCRKQKTLGRIWEDIVVTAEYSVASVWMFLPAVVLLSLDLLVVLNYCLDEENKISVAKSWSFNHFSKKQKALAEMSLLSREIIVIINYIDKYRSRNHWEIL